MKKEIDIREQPRLGVVWTLGMTLNGMRHRLSRSLVTLAVIVVAIAFLMNTVSEGLIKRSVGAHTAKALAQYRLAVAWAARISRVGTVEEVLRQLAAVPPEAPDAPAYGEARAMGGFDAQTMAAFHADAVLGARYLDWIAALDYGKRRRLVHGALGAEAFDRLQEAGELDAFSATLQKLTSLRFPTNIAAFDQFLQRWPQVKQQALAVRAGWARAIAEVDAERRGRPVLVALQDIDGAFGRALETAGFRLDRGAPAEVATAAKRMHESALFEQTLSSLEMCQAVAAYVDLLPGQINAHRLWDFVHDRKRAAWYLGKLEAAGMSVPGLDTERVLALARHRAKENALVRADRLSETGGEGVLSERMAWLAIVSMVVCIVGVANAMLMSVTQRFREIATLKCLGALDEFIATTFIMEACVLGIVGGAIGALVGLAIGLARMLGLFRSVLLEAIPFADLGVAVAVSVGLGIVLAAVATVLSALKAARLAPMEAMRVE